MIYTGQKVCDPLTNTYSTGYWVIDNRGNWYPVWRGEIKSVYEQNKPKEVEYEQTD